jgi:hypothetical protein
MTSFVRFSSLALLAFASAGSALAATGADPAIGGPPPAVPAGLRIFTCGHSFHTWVAPILHGIALSAGIKGDQVAGVSYIGASRVMQHWELPDGKNPVKAALQAGKVDVLTLSPIWLPDEGIEQFAAFALQHNPAVRVTVLESWVPNDHYHPVWPLETSKYVDHNAAIGADLREQDELYRKTIDDHVDEINRRLGRTVVYVVPVGAAVVALREKIIARSAPALTVQWRLFTDSWGHPTTPLKVLSAYCHYAVIYRRSPVGLPMPDILVKNQEYVSQGLNRLLQELAWDAVVHNPRSGVGPGAATSK